VSIPKVRLAPLLLWALTACQERPAPEAADARVDPAPSPPSADSLDRFVEWIGELALQERDSAFVADPELRADPSGGWLYWDRQIEQARLYDSAGKLKVVLGRAGDGPGEFKQIRALVRLDDERLVSVDRRGRVAVWDPSSYELLKDFSSGLVGVTGAVALPGSAILVTTAPELVDVDAAAAVVHILDVDGERVTFSGFHPPMTRANATALMTVAPTAPRHSEDSVYVGLSIFDTVWALPRRSASPEPNAASLSSRHVSANLPPPAHSEGLPAFRSWVDQSTFFAGFFPLQSGGALVQAWAFRDDKARFSYHRLNAAGVWQWETESSLELLEIDRGDLLYFWDRSDLVPSRIRIGRLR
jgi:hypothetical protein